jgi:hypothetical protein
MQSRTYPFLTGRDRKRNCTTALPKMWLAGRVEVVRIAFKAKCLWESEVRLIQLSLQATGEYN